VKRDDLKFISFNNLCKFGIVKTQNKKVHSADGDVLVSEKA
jgi:hypothetical protein